MIMPIRQERVTAGQGRELAHDLLAQERIGHPGEHGPGNGQVAQAQLPGEQSQGVAPADDHGRPAQAQDDAQGLGPAQGFLEEQPGEQGDEHRVAGHDDGRPPGRDVL